VILPGGVFRRFSRARDGLSVCETHRFRAGNRRVSQRVPFAAATFGSQRPRIAAALVSPNGHNRIRRSPKFVDSFSWFPTREKE
jgi:hypothetical protein